MILDETEPFKILLDSLPMTISDLDRDRKNNFDLLRLIAATLVIIEHSFLVTGNFFSGPMSYPVNYMDLGGFGVKVFFAISGFLIVKSLLRQPTLSSFVWARCLRIFPGLIIAAILCALIIGPICTTLPLKDYFQSRAVYSFAYRLIIQHNFGNTLPHTFEHLPYPNAVDSPLWTLPAELLMYLGVLSAGALLLLFRKNFKALLNATPVIILVALFFKDFHFDTEYLPDILPWAFSFLLGVTSYLARKHIFLNIYVLLVAVTSYATAAFFGYTDMLNYYIKMIMYSLVVVYGIMIVAYHPKLQVKGLHKLGDFSYGLYIYAFPLQQVLVSKFNLLNPFLHFLVSLPLALLIAVPSWYLIEKPALKLKAGRPSLTI
ncbi:acyltransferase family protein [Mucilaginibacter psychrotolerans]|uniref:Acyltransferase n=1 Tax=Mucilaginibacter psychrotolerans TaxID=1524096 RepID=A0A4Y8SI82_9SPHI|nr:acyltransferase [Mucilaginibacter psychrotolerans]TFF38759.1 acyltransferase [Mucilaginibacter psychrotolerans]